MGAPTSDFAALLGNTVRSCTNAAHGEKLKMAAIQLCQVVTTAVMLKALCRLPIPFPAFVGMAGAI
jgi:hypothetical protein